jgi:hypothetical protein
MSDDGDELQSGDSDSVKEEETEDERRKSVIEWVRNNALERSDVQKKLTRWIKKRDETKISVKMMKECCHLIMQRYFGLDLPETNGLFDGAEEVLFELCKIVVLCSKDSDDIYSTDIEILKDRATRLETTGRFFPVLDLNGCSMWWVASVLESVNPVDSPKLLSRLHVLKLKKSLIFLDSICSKLDAWGSPLLNIYADGMDKYASIPLMNHMLRNELLEERGCKKNWVVLVGLQNALYVTDDLPYWLTYQLVNQIKGMDTTIQHIILILYEYITDDILGQVKMYCFLICRDKGKITCITLLDNSWHDEGTETMYFHYTKRLVQLRAEILGGLGAEAANFVSAQGISIVLSDACATWLNAIDDFENVICRLRNHGGDYHNESGSIIHEAKHDGVFSRRKTGKIWLDTMLSEPLNYIKRALSGLGSGYEAALYVIGCVRESPVHYRTTKYVNGSFIIKMYNALNSELSSGILSGFCLLSSASLRVAQYRDNEAKIISQRTLETGSDKGPEIETNTDGYFLVIDSHTNFPSDTYAWAFRRKIDPEKGMIFETYALKNNEESDCDFQWTSCDLASGPSATELLAQLLTDSKDANEEYETPCRPNDMRDLSEVFYDDERYRRMRDSHAYNDVHEEDERYGELFWRRKDSGQDKKTDESGGIGDSAAASGVGRSCKEKLHPKPGESAGDDPVAPAGGRKGGSDARDGKVSKIKSADAPAEKKKEERKAGAGVGRQQPAPKPGNAPQNRGRGGGAAVSVDKIPKPTAGKGGRGGGGPQVPGIPPPANTGRGRRTTSDPAQGGPAASLFVVQRVLDRLVFSD